jgi:dTMP kinase
VSGPAPHIGVFITFEGGEGCGKSTQMERVAARLRGCGADVVVTREPGGTPVGDRIRALLLDPAHEGMQARAELLLYEASRAELTEAVIRPALDRGATVLCDRFYDSSTAYQAFARGLPLAEVLALNGLATGGLVPDRTLLLDVDPVVGLARAAGVGAADRLESEDLAFHQRVREGFLALAANEPERFRVVDANGDMDAVAGGVDAALEDLLS